VDIPLLVNKYRRAQADNAAMQNRIEERITAQLRHRELLMRKQVLLLRVQKARERVAEHAQWMERGTTARDLALFFFSLSGETHDTQHTQHTHTHYAHM
jgi:hypothetical protein